MNAAIQTAPACTPLTLQLGSTNAFDAENKPVKLEGTSVVFDALGRAVEAAGHEILYGPDGSKIGIMSGQSLVRADIALPGGAVAVYNASGLQYYRHAGGLGSAHLSTDPSGRALSSDIYSPFGFDETSASPGYRSFTGQKQDIDSTNSGGQYDFLMREYNPIQGRWWTADPAALAAVDPNNPQSWNRYAYTNGMPLRFRDPSGLQPCSNASLNKPNDTNVSGDQGAEFGPYDDGSQPTTEAVDDCGGGWQTCLLDGADIGCDLLGDLTGGGESISGAYACAWSDCMGAGGSLDSYGRPNHYLYDNGDGCAPGATPGSFNCHASVGTDNFPRIGSGLAACGLSGNNACTIAIIANGTGAPLWVSQGSAPGTPLAQISNARFYPRSYGAMVSCEFATTFGSGDKAALIGTINVAPFLYASWGNSPAALRAFGGAAIFDIGGAWNIRQMCIEATYGPSN